MFSLFKVKFVRSEHSPVGLHQSLDVVSAWVIGSRPQKGGPKLDSENKSKLSGVWKQNHQQKMNVNTHLRRSLNRRPTVRFQEHCCSHGDDTYVRGCLLPAKCVQCIRHIKKTFCIFYFY